MSTTETINLNNDEMTSEQWIAAHPEVAGAAPSWVTEIDASGDGPRVAISFDRTQGAVEIGAAASWGNGQIRQSDPGVYVYFRDNDALVTAEDLRRYASDFAAAAEALDASTRTVRRAADVNERLMGQDS